MLENKEQYEAVLKHLRRLNDIEIEQIASMITKKVKCKSSSESGLKILAVDFESFVTDNSNWKGAVNIVGKPSQHFFNELKRAVDVGYELAIVTPRVKYEGGEEAVLGWFRNNNCPSAVYNHLHVSSCIPFGCYLFSTKDRVITNCQSLSE